MIQSVAFSPDGKILATGSLDNTIRLWGVSTGAVLRTLKGHSNPVYSVVFSPDGKTLASGSQDGTVKLWDVSTGAELYTLNGSPNDEYSKVNSVSFSPDGKILASGSQDNIIRLWDVSTGAVLRILKGHSNSVHSIVFSPDGKTLVSSSADKTIRIWNVFSGSQVRTLSGQSLVIGAMAFSPDRKILASGGSDKILIWNMLTGEELRTLVVKARSISSIAFGPDGRTLAIGSWDKAILCDIYSGAELRTFKGHTSFITSVAFSPDGKTIASGSHDRTIKLWEVSTGAEIRTLGGHSNLSGIVAFSPDGKILAFAGEDKTVRLWEFPTIVAFRSIKETASLTSIAFSPDGRILATGSWDFTIKLWDISTGLEIRRLKGHDYNPAHTLVFSPDGKTLASVGVEKTLKLWNVSTGAELKTLKKSSYLIASIAFSPDGKVLASGNWDNTIRLWDVSTGAELGVLRGHSNAVYSVLFSPDGKTLASGSSGPVIKLWDISTGAQLRTLETIHALADPTQSYEHPFIAFSPDGKTLAGGTHDRTIKLWEVSTGALRHTLKGHSNSITSMSFGPNHKYLVSGSFDTSIKIWDIGSGKEIASLIAFGEKDWIAVTPDGLFDGSPAGWNKLIWRFNNDTSNYAPVEAFFSDFYYPGLLEDIFTSKIPQAPSDISKKDRRQPQLKLTLANGPVNTPLASRNMMVEIDISQAPAGARDVRLFRNGSLVKVWRGDVLKRRRSVTIEATIPIIAGENRLTAYAFNRDNIKSNDATLTVNGAESLKRQGTAYILAVGVNSYSNPQYNLKYAVADAQAFSTEIKRQQEMLKNYGRVEIISLVDGEATKANILQKLRQLVNQVQPEDAVIVYFAGHGTAQQNRFYLIPHDLGYDGPRKYPDEVGLRSILLHSISDKELEQAFEKIDARQILLVIDACNSGQALEAEEKRRGPMNSKGLAQLAYEKGIYILTAAQSYQAALEADRLGHGYLTYALVIEGLKGGAADDAPKDSIVFAREWLDYATARVPQMQLEKLESTRSLGKDFSFVEGEARDITPERKELQRPRVFYRRELEPNQMIVARPQAEPLRK